MDWLALRSGLRTDHLPTEAERAATALRNSGMADAMTTPPAPAPSMVEVIKQTGADFEHMRLQGVRTEVDDRRNARPVPAPPQRSYMSVPRVKDMLGG